MEFSQELNRLYREKKDFRSFVENDITGGFAFFGSEFAGLNNIDGHEIKSVIVNAYHGVDLERYEREGNNSEGVERSRIILYCRCSDIGGLRRDLSLRVNGRLYIVREYHDVNNFLWRIELEENE